MYVWGNDYRIPGTKVPKLARITIGRNGQLRWVVRLLRHPDRFMMTKPEQVRAANALLQVPNIEDPGNGNPVTRAQMNVLVKHGCATWQQFETRGTQHVFRRGIQESTGEGES